MRATKEESEKYKEECEDVQRKLQVEVMRREEVSFNAVVNFTYICSATSINRTVYSQDECFIECSRMYISASKYKTYQVYKSVMRYEMSRL